MIEALAAGGAALPARRVRRRWSPAPCTRPPSTTPASPTPAHRVARAAQAGRDVVMMLANRHRARGAARPPTCRCARSPMRSRAASLVRTLRIVARATAQRVRHRRAAHRRARPQSARRRRRPPRPRGNRRDRAGARTPARRRHATCSARCRPTPRSCRRKLRGFDAVLAMYHDQGLPVLKNERLRARGQHHPRPALSARRGRPRHRAGPRRQRRRRSVEPDRGDRRWHPARRARAWRASRMSRPRSTDAAGFSRGAKKHSASTSCTTAASSSASCSAIAPQPGDRMVEIGPGEGALTLPLLRAHGAADRDRTRPRPDAAACRPPPRSARRAAHRPRRRADGRFHRARRAAAQLRLVGNLPYNISSPILFHCARPRRMRSATCTSCCRRKSSSAWPRGPGSKVYGRLRVMLQLSCRVEPLFDVPPGAFRPPPKVDSAVVRLVPRARRARSAIDDRASLRGRRARRLRPAPQDAAPTRCDGVRRQRAASPRAGIDPARAPEQLARRRLRASGQRRTPPDLPAQPAASAAPRSRRRLQFAAWTPIMPYAIDIRSPRASSTTSPSRTTTATCSPTPSASATPARCRRACSPATGSSPTPTARCRRCAATAWSASSRGCAPARISSTPPARCWKPRVGTMRGSYQMLADDGTQFDAPIPPFTLSIPRTLH